ncbi:hypothetical protein IMCC3317_32490 [Kordia antarctica]|uniref:Uncharacterized protein n=1 Tax=Kordia antarctica TaxID=1218801 RepID=A0A7L4ZNT4_9FLAO|nr:hypothetical protein [Kordia antarctica]QHI37866.1 hypothetical protein IMCC3317_32490 [Kordia antarctica]
MKKRNLKSLKLNKKSISIINTNTVEVKGGKRTGAPCIFQSWATRCANASNCYCQ